MIINNKQREILTEIFSAIEMAAFSHRFQKRKGAGGIPYVNHPIEVTSLLMKTIEDPSRELIIAALLHDVLEDTTTTPDEIGSAFGEGVLHLVEYVTDDMKLPKKERRRLQIAMAPALPDEAKYIKIADKACNIKDIVNTRFYWSRNDKISYIEWAVKVVEQIRDAHKGLTEVFIKNLSEAESRLDYKFSFTL